MELTEKHLEAIIRTDAKVESMTGDMHEVKEDIKELKKSHVANRLSIEGMKAWAAGVAFTVSLIAGAITFFISCYGGCAKH